MKAQKKKRKKEKQLKDTKLIGTPPKKQAVSYERVITSISILQTTNRLFDILNVQNANHQQLST